MISAILFAGNRKGLPFRMQDGQQVVDVSSSGRQIEREKLDFIYALKTGALIESSMMIGAVLAGASKD